MKIDFDSKKSKRKLTMNDSNFQIGFSDENKLLFLEVND